MVQFKKTCHISKACFPNLCSSVAGKFEECEELLGRLQSTPVYDNKGIHPNFDWLYRIEACAELI